MPHWIEKESPLLTLDTFKDKFITNPDPDFIAKLFRKYGLHECPDIELEARIKSLIIAEPSASLDAQDFNLVKQQIIKLQFANALIHSFVSAKSSVSNQQFLDHQEALFKLFVDGEPHDVDYYLRIIGAAFKIANLNSKNKKGLNRYFQLNLVFADVISGLEVCDLDAHCGAKNRVVNIAHAFKSWLPKKSKTLMQYNAKDADLHKIAAWWLKQMDESPKQQKNSARIKKLLKSISNNNDISPAVTPILLIVCLKHYRQTFAIHELDEIYQECPDAHKIAVLADAVILANATRFPDNDRTKEKFLELVGHIRDNHELSALTRKTTNLIKHSYYDRTQTRFIIATLISLLAKQQQLDHIIDLIKLPIVRKYMAPETITMLVLKYGKNENCAALLNPAYAQAAKKISTRDMNRIISQCPEILHDEGSVFVRQPSRIVRVLFGWLSSRLRGGIELTAVFDACNEQREGLVQVLEQSGTLRKRFKRSTAFREASPDKLARLYAEAGPLLRDEMRYSFRLGPFKRLNKSLFKRMMQASGKKEFSGPFYKTIIDEQNLTLPEVCEQLSLVIPQIITHKARPVTIHKNIMLKTADIANADQYLKLLVRKLNEHYNKTPNETVQYLEDHLGFNFAWEFDRPTALTLPMRKEVFRSPSLLRLALHEQYERRQKALRQEVMASLHAKLGVVAEAADGNRLQPSTDYQWNYQYLDKIGMLPTLLKHFKKLHESGLVDDYLKSLLGHMPLSTVTNLINQNKSLEAYFEANVALLNSEVRIHFAKKNIELFMALFADILNDYQAIQEYIAANPEDKPCFLKYATQLRGDVFFELASRDDEFLALTADENGEPKLDVIRKIADSIKCQYHNVIKVIRDNPSTPLACELYQSKTAMLGLLTNMSPAEKQIILTDAHTNDDHLYTALQGIMTSITDHADYDLTVALLAAHTSFANILFQVESFKMLLQNKKPEYNGLRQAVAEYLDIRKIIKLQDEALKGMLLKTLALCLDENYSYNDKEGHSIAYFNEANMYCRKELDSLNDLVQGPGSEPSKPEHDISPVQRKGSPIDFFSGVPDLRNLPMYLSSESFVM